MTEGDREYIKRTLGCISDVYFEFFSTVVVASKVCSHSCGAWFNTTNIFLHSSYDKKCISSTLSVHQLQRRPLLPRHFEDTQITIPDGL